MVSCSYTSSYVHFNQLIDIESNALGHHTRQTGNDDCVRREKEHCQSLTEHCIPATNVARHSTHLHVLRAHKKGCQQRLIKGWREKQRRRMKIRAPDRVSTFIKRIDDY